MRIFFKVFFIMRLLNMLCIRESKKFIPRQSSYFIPMTSAYSLYIYDLAAHWNAKLEQFLWANESKILEGNINEFFCQYDVTRPHFLFFLLSLVFHLFASGWLRFSVCVRVCVRALACVHTYVHVYERKLIYFKADSGLTVNKYYRKLRRNRNIILLE